MCGYSTFDLLSPHKPHFSPLEFSQLCFCTSQSAVDLDRLEPRPYRGDAVSHAHRCGTFPWDSIHNCP
uniref:Uncharacterized protein n=1 Tax=Anguilla anguilla TaxID=7936 RepID=A0A0E9TWA1_ANGAN